MHRYFYRLEDAFQALAEDDEWWPLQEVMQRLGGVFAALGDTAAMKDQHQALLASRDAH